MFFKVNARLGFIALEDGSLNGNSDLWQDNGKNVIKLQVNNGIAQVLVNDIFLNKVTLSDDKLNVLYDKLVITNIDKHIIYSMKLNNGISGSKFAADISRDLVNLRIPQVNYDVAEGVRVLWADLKRFPNTEGKILFEVVDFGNYPK